MVSRAESEVQAERGYVGLEVTTKGIRTGSGMER